MESENLLYKLIFPDGCPNELDIKANLASYMTKLGSNGVEELCKEPNRLKEDKLAILEHTQDLAVSNYKAFIQTAVCSKESFLQFNEIESKLDSLLDNVPKFYQKCETFVDESGKINNQRKLNSTTLVKNAQLLEILEMPQLMESFIKDSLYEEAFELFMYVQRLHAKHMDIPIFEEILAEVNKLWEHMLHQLLLQLRTNIQLPKCLQIIGLLRRMNIFGESELRLKFLQARNYWLLNSLNAIPKSDANQHLSKTIEITRVNLFSIITQYRAIFNDDDHGPLVSTKQSVNPNCIFFSWLKQKIYEFLETLEFDLNNGVTSIDSYLGQCMYFGLSFSKVGCDFRNLIIPVFLRIILRKFEDAISQATKEFDMNMEKFTLINKNHSKSSWKNKNADPLQPPDSLIEFYPLAEYLNKVLTLLNSLRLCAPMAILNEVVSCLEESLCHVAKGISNLYGQEHQAFTPNAKDAFTRLCIAFADDLVPFLQRAIHIIYPPNNITQFLGINIQNLQDKGISFLNRQKIIYNVKDMLPVKINTITALEDQSS